MLDPFTALSLAASIAQFIEFGWKVVSEAKGIYESESSTKSMIIGYRPERIASLAENIKHVQKQLQQREKSPLSDPEMALTNVANASLDEARKLETILNKIKTLQDKAERERATVGGRVKALLPATMAAVKTIWKLEAIRDFHTRLNDLRQEVDSHILVVMNAKLDRQDERIVEILTICNQLQSHLARSDYSEAMTLNGGCRFRPNNLEIEGQDTIHVSDQLQGLSQVKNPEAITVILTTSEGSSRTITRRPTEEFTNEPDFLKTRIMQRQFTFGRAAPADSSTGERYQENSYYDNDENDFSRVTRQIVDALHYRMIHEREESISEAHSRTFDWIWKDSTGVAGSWTDFPSWLKHGNGCYWINGKAGAGKSTLMKYIYRSPNMKRHLDDWCGSKELIIASFFFWRAGTPLQKTQNGLLRSLLFETLDTRRDMVPLLFPSLCRELTIRAIPNLSLSFNELRAAMSTLLNSMLDNQKLFLIIDGIDEYEGDQNDVLELFAPDTESNSAKILVSSRPSPVCADAFEDCPSLRLQDLTVEDIARYVSEKLSDHKLMKRMQSTPDGRGVTEELVHGITEKASGVFLWVILVVKSLLTGLQNSDSKQDLIQRLHVLPPDLESLYRHMLQSMSMEYQRQASIMLQLVLRSSDIQPSQMTVLQLSFAEEGNPLSAVDYAVERLSSVQETARCKATEGRMRSRCCGLIEGQWSSRSHSAADMCVGFLHRTVIDFLTESSVAQHLQNLTLDHHIDLDEVLLASNLKEMKCRPERARKSNLLNILAYAPFVEKTNLAALQEYIDQTESVIQQHRRDVDLFFYDWAWDAIKEHGARVFRPINEDRKVPHPFHMLLAVFGLTQTLKQRIQSERCSLVDKQLLLVHLIWVFLDGVTHPSPRRDLLASRLSGIEVILEDGQDVNAEVHIGPPFQPVELRNLSDYGITKTSVRTDAKGCISPWTLLNVWMSWPWQWEKWRSLNRSLLYPLLHVLIHANADLDMVIATELGNRTSHSIISSFIHQAETCGPGNARSTQLEELLKKNKLKKQNSLSLQKVTKVKDDTSRKGFRGLFSRSKK